MYIVYDILVLTQDVECLNILFVHRRPTTTNDNDKYIEKNGATCVSLQNWFNSKCFTDIVEMKVYIRIT